jgi:hypothetical protein
MDNKEGFNRQVRRTASLTVALVGFVVFGAVVLADSDWIPGGIIVGSALIGLARQIPVIRKLCSTGPAPSRPSSKPAN